MINKRGITLPVVYRRPFASKSVFFERFWMNLSSPLTVLYNRKTREETLFWKGSSAGRFSPKIASLRFAPLSNFAAWKSKDSRFFSYLAIENLSKRPGASPRRKSKSHSIRATGMRSKILMCQRQPVALWLIVVQSERGCGLVNPDIFIWWRKKRLSPNKREF